MIKLSGISLVAIVFTMLQGCEDDRLSEGEPDGSSRVESDSGGVRLDSGAEPDAAEMGDATQPVDASDPTDSGTIEDSGATPDAGDAATGPSGESCGNPIPLALSNGTVTIQGDTTGAVHDQDGPSACGQCQSYIDLVYSVDVPARTRVRAHYTGASGIVDCVSVQRACPENLVGGFTCGDPETTLTNPQAGKDFDTAGTAYIFIWADGEKTFTLLIETESY